VLGAVHGGRAAATRLGPRPDDLVVRGGKAAPRALRLLAGRPHPLRILQPTGGVVPVRRCPPSGPASTSLASVEPSGSSATSRTSSCLRMSDVPVTPASFASRRSSATVVYRSSVSLTAGVFGVWVPGFSAITAPSRPLPPRLASGTRCGGAERGTSRMFRSCARCRCRVPTGDPRLWSAPCAVIPPAPSKARSGSRSARRRRAVRHLRHRHRGRDHGTEQLAVLLAVDLGRQLGVDRSARSWSPEHASSPGPGPS